MTRSTPTVAAHPHRFRLRRVGILNVWQYDDLIAADPLLAPAPWTEEWLAGVRRSGLLATSAGLSLVLDRAVAVLSTLLGQTRASWSRVELAASVVGDAHALDDGTALGQVVLRGVAALTGQPVPALTTERRALWERVGVAADAVSATCLTLGLRPLGDDPLAARMITAADAGDPVHVTAWDLRRCSLAVAAGTPVLVCENPSAL